MPRLETLILRDDHVPQPWPARIADAIRSYWRGPFSATSGDLAFFRGTSTAGMPVTEQTALGVSAFFCAVTAIASDVASLPLCLYKNLPDGGKTRFESHPLYRLLHDQPNPETTAYAWRSALLINTLATGNGYAEIERDTGGRPIALWHIAPERVSSFREGGVLRYRVANVSGGEAILDPRDLLHLKGPSPDGVFGWNVVELAREALGLALAAETYGSAFFKNGANSGGLLMNPGNLTELARENLRKAIESRHQGAGNAHKLLLLENGTTFTATASNARDSQFAELRVHQIREVARFFRIPVSLLGDLERSTFSNHEQQQLQYYTNCLRPWLVNLEQELSAKLIAPSERNLQTIEFVVEGFLRADSEKRAAFYQTMISNGVMTINEVREKENLPPVDGGDVPRVPLNFEPLRP